MADPVIHQPHIIKNSLFKKVWVIVVKPTDEYIIVLLNQPAKRLQYQTIDQTYFEKKNMQMYKSQNKKMLSKSKKIMCFPIEKRKHTNHKQQYNTITEQVVLQKAEHFP